MEDNQTINNDTSDLGYSINDFNYEMFLRKRYDPFVDYLIMRKGREGIWEVVDAIIRFMMKYFPEEIKEVTEEVRKDRELSLNEYGSSQMKSLRKLGSVPSRLENLLYRAYLGEFPMPMREFRRKFFKRYPAFRVADKI